jgi:hypothetical protein
MLGLVSAKPAAGAGLGTFADESSRLILKVSSNIIATDVKMIDVDLDGDLDVYVSRGDLAGGTQGGAVSNLLFLNDGSGTFTKGPNASPKGDWPDTHFADVTSDGFVDAVVSGNVSIERLLVFNPLRGKFADRTRFMPPNQPEDVTIESQFFDANGDGLLDIITANEDPFVIPGAQNRLYLNTGSADRPRYVDATSNLPAILDDSSGFCIGDFRGVGIQDAITVNNGPNVYLKNDGTGHFTDETSTRLPGQPTNMDSGRDCEVADFDGDGDPDVMFAISRQDQGPVLWLNNGSGVFTDVSSTNVPLATRSAQDLEVCDLDGDGDPDVIEGDSGAVLNPPTDHKFAGAQNRILLNDGSGHFTDVTSSVLPSVVDATFSVACGDITGDGRPDLVVSNADGEPMKVYVQQPAT